jgi:hypothetical protein
MSNPQKTPYSRLINNFGIRRAKQEIAKRGQRLPGSVISVSGAIVTVSFEVSGVNLPQVTMPLAGAEYVRYPIQSGDLGYATTADAYLGGISGLGGGVADETLRANLSTLVWVPIGNESWSEVDPNAVTIYGPNGVVLRDSDNNTSSTLTPDGISDSAKETYEITAGTSITLTVGSHSIVIASSGITIDGKVFLTHEHTNVTTGTVNTGGVA